MLGQQQPWCFRCQPDHGHPCFEPLNGEDELCARRTRVVLEVGRSLTGNIWIDLQMSMADVEVELSDMSGELRRIWANVGFMPARLHRKAH